MPDNAPTREIGYAQASIMSGSSANWWMFEDETTPELRWPQSIQVFDQMRSTDSQVQSVLRAVTHPLLRTPWRVDPSGASAAVTKFVADDLGLPVVGKPPTPLPRTRDRFSWTDHLNHALLMLPFGYSFFEQVYRIDEGASRAHLRKLAPRLPKTIAEINVARDGGLVSIKQYPAAGSADSTPIPVDRLVAYVHQKEGGNWLGRSILRAGYKNWLIKDRLLRVQAQTIERNGMGIPVYTAAETEKDTTSGLGLATTLRSGEAAGAALPFGAMLRLMGVEGQLPDAEPAIRYHDEQLARAVLAHFLNLGTQTGSWALGSTFADFFVLSLQMVGLYVADIATQHIVEDLVDLNFGENEPAPKIVFDEIGSRQAATAEAIKSLIDAGVITADDVLEGAVRQQYGLPPRDEATERKPPEPGGATPPAQTQPDERPGSVAASAAYAEEVTAKFNPNQLRDNEGQWTDGTPGVGGSDPLGVADSLAGGPDKFVGSTRAGSDPNAVGVNVVATEYGGDTSFTITTGTAKEARQGDEHADDFSILADEQIRKLQPKLKKAITAAENGQLFESKLDGEDNGDVIIGAKDGKVTVSARSWGWDEQEEEEDLRPPLQSRDDFESEQDPDDEPYSYEQYVADHAAGRFDYELREPTPPSWKTAELTVEQALELLSEVKRLTGESGRSASGPVKAHGPRVRARFTPGPKAVIAKFNKNQLRDDEGQWTDGTPGVGGVAIPLDKLKGAGRIDLQPGERLVRSDRTKGENGRAWLAVTEKDGKRSLRIGLGNEQFGTRSDSNGPWRAAQDRSYDINEEREDLKARRDDLENEISELEADPNADAAGLAARRAQLDELDDADTDEVFPKGHTAILDEQGAKQLRETIDKALDEGEAMQEGFDDRTNRIEELEERRNELRKIVERVFTDEEDAEWDRLTAEIEAIEAQEPPRPAQGYWTLAEGSIPGQWADVHYEVYLDDPTIGVETNLGAIPHHHDPDFGDLMSDGAYAHFAMAEADELVKLLAKMESGGNQVKAHLQGLHPQDTHGRRYRIPGDRSSGLLPRKPSDKKSKTPTPEDRTRETPVGRALRRAYGDVAGGSKGYVRLDEVRARLGDIPKDEVDRTLRQLAREKRIHLAPNDYQFNLTPQQRAGSVEFGGRANHLIMFDEASGGSDSSGRSSTDQIRNAYKDLQRRTGDWVPLADIRERLSGMPRDEQDAALKELAAERGVNLEPDVDQSRLTLSARRAAVRIGGEDRHLLSIDPPADEAPRGSDSSGQPKTAAQMRKRADELLSNLPDDPQERDRIHTEVGRLILEADRLDAVEKASAPKVKSPRSAKRRVRAKFNKNQLRDPGGESGGQWVKTPGSSVPGLLEGHDLYHDDEYWAEFGDEMYSERTESGIAPRIFEGGAAHLALDLDGDNFQVLGNLEDSEGMQSLAETLRDVLDLDLDSYGDGDEDDDGLVYRATDSGSGIEFGRYQSGDVFIRTEDDGRMDISQEDAQDLADKLDSVAEVWDREFEYTETPKVTAHLKGLHDQKDHGRKGGKLVPSGGDGEPATKPAKRTPRAPRKSHNGAAFPDEAFQDKGM